MKKMLYAVAFALIIGGLAYHFFALRLFNLLVPKDAGIDVVATEVAFGSHPRQRLDIYRSAAAAGPLPVIVFIYGGSWKDGSRADYAFAGKAFAARGYLAVVADYRVLPDHPFPAFVEDAAAAIAWAQREAGQYGGDPARIFAVGHSAGGYNLAQAVLDPAWLAAAGCAPCNLKAVALLAAPLDFLPLDTASTIAAFGAAPDVAQTQPVNFARKDAPPFLLLTGTSDTTVFPKNSRNLKTRITAAGGVAEIKEYPGISHAMIMLALAKPLRAKAPVLDDVTAFFARVEKQ